MREAHHWQVLCKFWISGIDRKMHDEEIKLSIYVAVPTDKLGVHLPYQITQIQIIIILIRAVLAGVEFRSRSQEMVGRGARFSFHDPAPSKTPSLEDDLGEVVGFYDNDGLENGRITVCLNGLQWAHLGQKYRVKYEDIVRAKLPNEKQSLSLELQTQDNSYLLPIDGHRDKFFDSLEWLRFINRIIAR